MSKISISRRLQVLTNSTRSTPFSVSRARKHSSKDWVFWNSRIGIGPHVPEVTGGAERRCESSPPRRDPDSDARCRRLRPRFFLRCRLRGRLHGFLDRREDPILAGAVIRVRVPEHVANLADVPREE
jgi:hypothetical protein